MALKQVEMGVLTLISGRVGSQVWREKNGRPEQRVLRCSVMGSEFIINMDMSDEKHVKVFDYVNSHPNCEMQIRARVEGNAGYYRYYYESAELVQLKLAKAEIDEVEAKAVFGQHFIPSLGFIVPFMLLFVRLWRWFGGYCLPAFGFDSRCHKFLSREVNYE